MKIVLAALNAKYVHSNLAVYDIEGYVKKHQKRKTEGQELPELIVKEYTINHNLDLILQSLYQEKAEVIAFSCYIWNISEILTIARELQKVAPDIRIWLGGPEASYDCLKLLTENPFLEGVIQGEGEVTFYELVNTWNHICSCSRDVLKEYAEVEKSESAKREKDNLCGAEDDLGVDWYRNILGITYRSQNGKIVENQKRPLMSMDEVPFIYENLSRFENKILYYESSRGCPFSCSYCLSSIDKSVRFRSIELVKKELQFFLDQKVPQVKFVDRTFNCKKEHALAIWNYITEHDNGVTNFHFEVSADLLGEEELEVMKRMRPGLIQLEIGLQSTNPATIQEIRRSMNIEKLKANMMEIREFGNIHQHLDLIAGLPYEDFATFQQSFNDAYKMRPNQLQLGFLKVLKGSYMGERAIDYELKYQDTQPYEVLSTKWISYDEILRLKKVEEMVEVYYNSDQFEHVLLYLIPFFESPYVFYETLGEYYEKKNLFGIGFKREARYEVLREFSMEWFEKNNIVAYNQKLVCKGRKEKREFRSDLLDSLLTYDYYLRENAKSRPSWAKPEPVEKSVYQDFFKKGGTEEIVLSEEGYDSKVAARMMHIEPIIPEAVCWIKEEFEWNQEQEVYYCLFDYSKRNMLSKDADVVILSHL